MAGMLARATAEPHVALTSSTEVTSALAQDHTCLVHQFFEGLPSLTAIIGSVRKTAHIGQRYTTGYSK